MTDLVVAKFGGTSVADFDAMNRSVDVALLDANTRVVVLSAFCSPVWIAAASRPSSMAASGQAPRAASGRS